MNPLSNLTILKCLVLSARRPKPLAELSNEPKIIYAHDSTPGYSPTLKDVVVQMPPFENPPCACLQTVALARLSLAIT